MGFVPDDSTRTWTQQPCTDPSHFPPGMWVPQTSGWWVCPSCGYKTRVEPARTICTGPKAPNNPPGVYTQGECCGNCVVCPYAVKITFSTAGDTVSNDVSSTALDPAVRELPARDA